MAAEVSESKAVRIVELSSPGSSMWSGEKEVEKDGIDVSSDDDDEGEEDCDSDSGVGSDDYDLLDVGGEPGTEFCQVGDQTFKVPLELYDLPDLSQVLSLDVWNECLSDEEKFGLCKYLPDMDERTFMRTLMDLLSGSNIFFGNPVRRFSEMLKGGLCEPRVALRRQGLMFFQKQRYYHHLRNYQNDMVCGLVEVKDAWAYCKVDSIEDKIKIFNDTRSRRRPENQYVRGRGLKDSSDKGEPFEGLSSGGQLKGLHSSFGKPLRSYASLSRSKGLMNLRGLRKLPELRHKNTSGNKAVLMRDKMEDRNGAAVLMAGIAGLKDRNLCSSLVIEKSGGPKLKNKKRNGDFSGGRFDIDAATNQNMSLTSRGKKKSSQMFLARSRIEPPSMDLYSNDDWNSKRKRAKSGRVSPDVNKDSHGSSRNLQIRGKEIYPSGKKRYNILHNGEPDSEAFRRIEMFARNDDTELDLSEHRDDGAYRYGLNNNLKAAVDLTNFGFYKKRKSGSVSMFELASSGKKTFNLNDLSQMTKSDKRSSKTKKTRKSVMRNGVGFTTLNCKLDRNGNSLECVMEDGGDVLPEAHGFPKDDLRSRSKKGDSSQAYEGDDPPEHFLPLRRCSLEKKKVKGKKSKNYTNKLDDARLCGASPQPVELNDTTNPDTHKAIMEIVNLEPEPSPKKKTYTPITPTVDCNFMFSVIHLLSAVRTALITPCLKENLVIQNHEGENSTHKVLDKLPGEVSNGVSAYEKVPDKLPGEVFNDISACERVLHKLPGEVSNGITACDKVLDKLPGEISNSISACHKPEASNSVRPEQVNVPTLSIQEIVNRVRLNPGDACILEIPEPLPDLIRGLLKIFSSKTAPLGAKSWKPLVKYERSTKSWSWIGPFSGSSSEPETSPGAWGLPHRMLSKLVDAFANWLKSGQEVLRLIGSLPPPPASLMQFSIEAKDRLKDLRVQKSLNTISPSPEEVRDYFRKEEFLRYSIPERAFTYTTVDGRKSTVAPLRRGGGKPSSKARDHFMLKGDRPPHVTILCLVRDAAARLPGSIGTRADVATLIRDSQYIAEDVTDAQVNQILSGALDRLHYERDPCVKFEQERKLWVYLHRDRDEEDFDEDGTLSTKKWKKSKNPPGQGSDVAANYVPEQVNMSTTYFAVQPQHQYMDVHSFRDHPLFGVQEQQQAMGFLHHERYRDLQFASIQPKQSMDLVQHESLRGSQLKVQPQQQQQPMDLVHHVSFKGSQLEVQPQEEEEEAMDVLHHESSKDPQPGIQPQQQSMDFLHCD